MSQSLLTGFSDTKCSVKWSPPPLCPPPPSSYIPESCWVESRPAAPSFIHQRLDWSASARPSPRAAMRCCDEVKSPRQVVCAARATRTPSRRRPLVFCCISSPEVCFTSVFLLSHTHSLVFDLVVCVCVLGEGWGVTLTSPPPSQVLQAWTADLITARWGQSVSSLSACPDLWTSTASIITARSKRFQSLAARPRHSPGVGYTKDACTQTTHKHGFLCWKFRNPEQELQLHPIFSTEKPLPSSVNDLITVIKRI